MFKMQILTKTDNQNLREKIASNKLNSEKNVFEVSEP